jgi:hypothetical protein
MPAAPRLTELEEVTARQIGLAQMTRPRSMSERGGRLPGITRRGGPITGNVVAENPQVGLMPPQVTRCVTAGRCTSLSMHYLTGYLQACPGDDGARDLGEPAGQPSRGRICVPGLIGMSVPRSRVTCRRNDHGGWVVRAIVRQDPLAPSWQMVKGDLIHRCALAAAGKWLSIEEASEICEGEPVLVYEARWLASKLEGALSGDLEKTDPNPDRDLAWALIDPGGPYWTGHCDEFQNLSAPDRSRALKGLTDQSVRTAQELLDEAERDDWGFVLSEAFNPFAFLDAARGADKDGRKDKRYKFEAYKEARKRMDLLIQRKLKSPLIVDLKNRTREPTPDILNKLVDEVARDYGIPAAKVYGRDIQCRVLYLTFTGRVTWSELRSCPASSTTH